MALVQGPQGSALSGTLYRNSGLQHACMGAWGAQPAPHKLCNLSKVPF